IFQPAYTIRRGRCFKTAVPLYQRSLDELGKFRIQMRNPAIMNISHDPEDEMLLFIGDAKPDIEPYPRYYLYERQYNKFRLMARHFHLLPGSEHCSDEYSTVGKATCYLTKWLVDNLENPYHCTYPYMDKIRNVSLPSAEPKIRVNCQVSQLAPANAIISPCTGGENKFELSLFLGTSIMTIIQVFLMLLILSKRVCTGRRNSTRIVMTPATEAEVKRNPSEGEMTRANNFYVSSPDFYAPISKRGLRPDEPTNDTVPRTETTIY
ncbi:unnamed protein product, partial [Toxocara canis]|uniref:Conserved plasma membrane protein n=1 Tax=Toxocara canis TaxID=6265 RepID=A0A183UZM7_TOXCA